MLKNRGFVRFLMLIDRLSIFTRNNCPEWVKFYLDKSSSGYIAVKAFPFGSLVCLCGIQRIADIQALLLIGDNNTDLNVILLIFIQFVHS